MNKSLLISNPNNLISRLNNTRQQRLDMLDRLREKTIGRYSVRQKDNPYHDESAINLKLDNSSFGSKFDFMRIYR